MKPENLKRIIVLCFVFVPLLSSIISTVHLVDLFYLGNPSWISYTVAVSIEVGAVASFLTLSILSKLNKGIVWGMFIILFLMQVIGNVYFSYDWVTRKIVETPDWISTFKEMIEFFIYEVEEKTTKMILALLIGVPIPLISVFLLKSTTDYLGSDITEAAPVLPHEKQIELLHDKGGRMNVIKESTEEQKTEEGEIHITEDISENGASRKRFNPARA
jgi:hypothetical protein